MKYRNIILFFILINIIQFSLAMKKEKKFLKKTEKIKNKKNNIYPEVQAFKDELKNKSREKRLEMAENKIEEYNKKAALYKKIKGKIKKEEKSKEFMMNFLEDNSINFDSVKFDEELKGIMNGRDVFFTFNKSIHAEQKAIEKLKNKAKATKPTAADTAVLNYAKKILEKDNSDKCTSSCWWS